MGKESNSAGTGRLWTPPKAFDALSKQIECVRAKADSSSEIQRIRDDLWKECLRAADSPAGTWTLSAPTGSGKTLSMLAFALRHAIQNRLRRIIVVIPFLTIIEQTAQIYRKVFGADYPEEFVLEDHSLAGTGEETNSRGDQQNHFSRLLAENWDAPIIITTHVQLLQSLFSNRPFACRKLHNLASSVILFDEVQTLPLDIVLPTLSALSHLSTRFGSSIVFATATQPAFDHLNPYVHQYGKNTEWKPKEIVSCNLNLFSRSKRTEVHWPDLDKPAPFSQIAEDLLTYKQVLCIVNVKRHAWELIGIMNQDGDNSLFHLSTSMCPAHRTHTLELIRQRLEDKKPCRLISTQCVEAGVDIDFPVVYRALGPLEAIAQAAGRCNRNGLWESGEVFVFLPENDGKIQYPPGGYEQAASVTRMLLKEKGEVGMDIDDPCLFEEYYRTLYDLKKPESMNESLKNAIFTGDFPEIAKEYRLIKQNTINVLAPYGGCIDLFRSLRAEAEESGLSASWIRRSRPLTVNLYKTNSSDKNPYLIPISYHGQEETDWYFYSKESHYDDRLGLRPEQPDLLLI
ncbi:MAG: CRISPR-associated helicase Cas3' [Candidatus Omnitrophota bacterium]